jgi:hypothetical protein
MPFIAFILSLQVKKKPHDEVSIFVFILGTVGMDASSFFLALVTRSSKKTTDLFNIAYASRTTVPRLVLKVPQACLHLLDEELDHHKPP